MASIPDTTERGNSRIFRALLVIALALLAVEALHQFSHPWIDPDQQALTALEGKPAPDFSVTTIDGQTFHLADHKGKKVFLNFWATWCVPCQIELPDYIKFTAAASNRVAIVAMSTEDEELLKTFVKRSGINYPVAQLKNVPSPYQDVGKIPVTMVIDRNGVIQHALLGVLDLGTLQKFETEPDFAGK